MAVSDSFKTYLTEQLGRARPVTTRSMFGGLGIYAEGLFFALADDNVVYFKVDDTNRSYFEDMGMGPFRPYGDDRAMQYYEVPSDVLEDVEKLKPWIDRSLDVARAAAAKKSRKKAKKKKKE